MEPAVLKVGERTEGVGGNPLIVSSVEVMDPASGEVLDISTTDGLALAYEAIQRFDTQLYQVKSLLKQMCLAQIPTTGPKTQRIAGESLVIKVERPNTNWNQHKLKQAWNDYPQHAKTYLKIAEIAPQLKEINKLRNTVSKDESFVEFTALVLGAEEPATANPSIKIEMKENHELDTRSLRSN